MNCISQETFEYTGPWKSSSTTTVFLDINGTVMETTAYFKHNEFEELETTVSDTFVLIETIES